MSRITHTIQIKALPQAVFDAVSRQDGIAHWWTADVHAEAVVGSVAEFGFYDRAIVTRFRIEALERPARIRWYCVGGPPEYVDSEVTFEFERTPEGTRVQFEHGGLKGADDFAAHAEQSWKRVLASLKAYVETGAGTPISM